MSSVPAEVLEYKWKWEIILLRAAHSAVGGSRCKLLTSCAYPGGD